MDECSKIRKGFLESRISTSYPDSVLSLCIHHHLSSELINNANFQRSVRTKFKEERPGRLSFIILLPTVWHQ